MSGKKDYWNGFLDLSREPGFAGLVIWLILSIVWLKSCPRSFRGLDSRLVTDSCLSHFRLFDLKSRKRRVGNFSKSNDREDHVQRTRHIAHVSLDPDWNRSLLICLFFCSLMCR